MENYWIIGIVAYILLGLHSAYFFVRRYTLDYDFESDGIEVLQVRGEDVDSTPFDEVWLYNVLQHVQNYKKVIEKCFECGRLIRVFEWVYTGIDGAHLNTFTPEQYDDLFKTEGSVVVPANNTTKGWCALVLGDAE